jgi:hypothetical protein
MTQVDLDAIRRNVRFAINLIKHRDTQNAIGTLEDVDKALAEAAEAEAAPRRPAPSIGWSGPTTAG